MCCLTLKFALSVFEYCIGVSRWRPSCFFPNDTNFKSNLALVVPYHPGKFQIDLKKLVQIRVSKPKCLQIDGRTYESNRWIGYMHFAQSWVYLLTHSCFFFTASLLDTQS